MELLKKLFVITDALEKAECGTPASIGPSAEAYGNSLLTFLVAAGFTVKEIAEAGATEVIANPTLHLLGLTAKRRLESGDIAVGSSFARTKRERNLPSLEHD